MGWEKRVGGGGGGMVFVWAWLPPEFQPLLFSHFKFFPPFYIHKKKIETLCHRQASPLRFNFC